jgi:AcrR family transcriptional regulator
MRIKIKKPTPQLAKRGRGQRAGLTREIILAKAVRLLQERGAGEFSLRVLAKALGVQSRTIHSHLKGGLAELGTALAQRALSDVARPFKPRETPADYIRELFRAVIAAVHGQASLARTVALELSNDYFLNPIVPERILVALVEIGVTDEELAPALNLVMGSLIGLLLTEAAKSERGPSMARKALKITAALPPREFATLKAHAEGLAEHMAGSDSTEPSWETADRFAHAAISGCCESE